MTGPAAEVESTTEERDFTAFFCDATGGFHPYGWQTRVAIEGLPQLLPVPTGLGKTEGAVLAWSWRRLRRPLDEPLHLVYCLPMRSLVRQTVERLAACLDRLAEKRPDIPRMSVYQLMGGSIDEEWARWPDRPWVLVGTQDQLLSRALNRGYAMDRFQWPVHFGLLNQDCQWIVDEVQLMGPGLWTTAQLDWMRRKRFGSLKPCRTTWMSATIGMGFLETTDRKRDGFDVVAPFDPGLDRDENQELCCRREARRPVERFVSESGKKARPFLEQVTEGIRSKHVKGTLTLVVCNTVKTAQEIFGSLAGDTPSLLLTSRFRAGDRQTAEQNLIEFDARRRRDPHGPIADDPGLICVSTQVVEAGLDISAHRLWSEHAPWPSLIQRLGRLNRDGRANDDARAYIWELPKPTKSKRNGETWIGPYRETALVDAKRLIEALIEPSSKMPFGKAVDIVGVSQKEVLGRALEPQLEPHPRALDVHGLFSTEQDVHGGFTDVGRFVRGPDPDADVLIFWRDWTGARPPGSSELAGDPVNLQAEGCPVAVQRVREMLKAQGARAWTWNDEGERWEPVAPDDVRPGMTLMLHADTGGYDATLGWTGDRGNRLEGLPPPGPGRVLRGDERVRSHAWVPLAVHLKDARGAAQEICDGVGLTADKAELRLLRSAVVEGAGLHDLGKAHPDWQRALPAGVMGSGPWAKCPYVLRIEFSGDDTAVRAAVERLSPGALTLPDTIPSEGKTLRYALDAKLWSEALEEIRNIAAVRKAVHEPLRPGLRHEAASALALWHHWRNGQASYPALAVYLAAAHHGKVRTVLRAISDNRDDVFGLRATTPELIYDGAAWPLDFSVARDGADGEWREDGFVLTGHGWTGLVADLLGPWRGGETQKPGVVPAGEPHHLGPFALAWLEALVRAADWRASEAPSQGLKPSEVPRDH